MKTRIVGLTVLFALVLFPTFGLTPTEQKERYGRFEDLLKQEDFVAADALLRKWQAESPDDADLAVAWSNYYMQKGKDSLSIYKGPRNDRNVDPTVGDVLAIDSPETSQTIGFLDTRPRFADDSLTRTLALLLDAVTTHPQRTDIWMGATHIQLMAEDMDGAMNTLRGFAEYAHKHPKELRTRFDEPLQEKSSEFMPKTLHSYALRGFNTETTAGVEFMLDTARLAQRLYPEHPYGYNDEAVYYSLKEDDESVLKVLIKAHKVRPDDPVITMNIAATYRNLKQTDKAREFYKLTVKAAKDDEDMKSAAREALDDLSEN